MRILIFIILLGTVSCVSLRESSEGSALNKAAFDLNCSKENITLSIIDQSPEVHINYGARGCGKQVTYYCTAHASRANSSKCIKESETTKVK